MTTTTPTGPRTICVTLYDEKGESVTLTVQATGWTDAIDQLRAAGWETWRRRVTFPKLAIKESGIFEGRSITRLSARLYEYDDNPRLSHTKQGMIDLALNKPIGASELRPMKRPDTGTLPKAVTVAGDWDIPTPAPAPDPVAGEIATDVLRKLDGIAPPPPKAEAVPCEPTTDVDAINAALVAHQGQGARVTVHHANGSFYLLVQGDGAAIQARAASFAAGWVAARKPRPTPKPEMTVPAFRLHGAPLIPGATDGAPLFVVYGSEDGHNPVTVYVHANNPEDAIARVLAAVRTMVLDGNPTRMGQRQLASFLPRLEWQAEELPENWIYLAGEVWAGNSGFEA